MAHASKSRSVRQASARAGSGSTQRNEPEPPKCPNVRGDVRLPDQCGCLPSLSSKPRPQSLGSKRPRSGMTPAKPGTGRSSPRPASPARSAVARATPRRSARGRRASREHLRQANREAQRPSREARARPPRDSARTACVHGWRRSPRRARCRGSSTRGASPANRRACPPRTATRTRETGDGAWWNPAAPRARRGRSCLPRPPRAPHMP